MRQFSILGCVVIFLAQTLIAEPTNSSPAKVAPKSNELEKLLAETANLPPEERKAKIKAFNEKHGLTDEAIQKHQAEFRQMTPEQRTKKLRNSLTELQKKKATGALTPAEEQHLKTLEDWSKKSKPAPGSSPASNVSTNKPSKIK